MFWFHICKLQNETSSLVLGRVSVFNAVNLYALLTWLGWICEKLRLNDDLFASILNDFRQTQWDPPEWESGSPDVTLKPTFTLKMRLLIQLIMTKPYLRQIGLTCKHGLPYFMNYFRQTQWDPPEWESGSPDDNPGGFPITPIYDEPPKVSPINFYYKRIERFPFSNIYLSIIFFFCSYMHSIPISYFQYIYITD